MLDEVTGVLCGPCRAAALRATSAETPTVEGPDPRRARQRVHNRDCGRGDCRPRPRNSTQVDGCSDSIFVVDLAAAATERYRTRCSGFGQQVAFPAVSSPALSCR